MDLTIPSHKLKTFTASLTTIGKIGKDLYWSFDPLEGLTLSTLNDAKSAFCRFHFECGFFERCALLPGFRIAKNNGERDRSRASARTRRDEDSVDGNGSEEERDDDDHDGEFETRYTCRVPLRAVHSIMRPSRKNVLSLRIRSEGRDAETGEYFGWTDGGRSAATERGGSGNPSTGSRRDGRRGRKRKNRHHQPTQQEEEEDEDGKEWRKMSYSERRRRSRSRAKRGNNYRENENDSDSDEGHNRERSNRNNSHKSNNANHASNNIPSNREEDKMMLTFEFFIESPTKFKHTHNKNNNSQTNNPNTPNSTTVFRSLHKVAVTTTHGISLSDKYSNSNSNSTYSSRSQIISHPKQWIRLLDPLQRTAQEVALRIDDALGVVTASSFHSGEYSAAGAGCEGGTRGENVLLLAAAARKAFLKTETSMNCQEFEEYDFMSNRGKKRRTRHRKEKGGGKMSSDGGNDRSGKRVSGSEGGTSTDEESDDEDNEDDGREFDFEREADRPPPDVNEKVILVFSMKEAKAMFQFCSQVSNYSNAYDGDSLSVVSFHWGGRPLVIETDGEFYNAELVLATLHHGMIASNVDVGGGGSGSDDRGNGIGTRGCESAGVAGFGDY